MNRRDERRCHHRRGGTMPRHEGEHRASYRTLLDLIRYEPHEYERIHRDVTSPLDLEPATVGASVWPRHTTSRLLVPFSAV